MLKTKRAISLNLPVEKSPTSEAYRILRTNFLRSIGEKSMKAILVTSASHFEGKTTTAINLALAISDIPGIKTLLVDADLRYPSIHERLSLNQAPGLTDIISGNIDLYEALLDTEKENFRVITCGSLLSYPAEILGGEKVHSLLKELKQEFDVILIDTPPVIPYTDASVLSSYTDGVLLVVHSGKTEKEDLVLAYQTLLNNKATILGLVLNRQKKFVSEKIYRRRL